MKLFVVAICTAVGVDCSRCNGKAPPGPRNLHPIDEAAPVFVRSVKNGKLYTVGQGDDKKDLIHVWGTPYENGLAMGQLLGPKLPAIVTKATHYMESQVITQLGNQTWCSQHTVQCAGLRWVAEKGLDVGLELSYLRTAPYIQPYVMEEIRGMSAATNGTLSVTSIRNIMWIGELTRGACSMFGAKDSATKSRGGKLLQLRALDWDTDGPFKDYPAVVVYHPESGKGHAWANVGFAAWTGSITGFSESQIGISEIGVSFPDSSFGPEHFLAKGYPFAFLMRDVLQFDESLEAATKRITEATRTCDLILGVGDGKANDFSGFQYSPHVATVIKPDNLLPVNDTWHPPVDDVVYWGMDWICPNDNQMLSHQLKKFHGQLTPEITISDITSYVSTGDLHIAIYDHAAMGTVTPSPPRPHVSPLHTASYRARRTRQQFSASMPPHGIVGREQPPSSTIARLVWSCRCSPLQYAHRACVPTAMYFATARQTGGDGPLPAYQRQFTKMDMASIFAETPP